MAGEKPLDDQLMDMAVTRARAGMEAYLHEKGEVFPDDYEAHQIGEAICDLLHLGKRKGFDAGAILRTATSYYLDEQGLVGL